MRLYRPPACPTCGQRDEVKLVGSPLNFGKIAIDVTLGFILGITFFRLAWRCESDGTTFRASGMRD